MDWTGGCLCGAIRYKSSEAPHFASYCHCGMCRKSSGAPYAGFVQFSEDAVQWLEGRPREYQSSPGIIRRFCGDCGSSLTFETEGVMFLSLGSLDKPENVRFECHTYTNTKLASIDLTDGLPQHPGPAGGKGGLPID